MKRRLAFFSLLLALATSFSAMAADRYSQSLDALPKAAREMLAKHFPGVGLNHVKIDRGGILGGTEYDAVLADGTEVEFNSDGKWVEVSVGAGKAVPAELVLPRISTYVSKHYGAARIIQIKSERNKYEVDLSNGVDLEFDSRGNFVRVDD